MQAFRTAGILNCDINHCFKINDKQMAKMSKKSQFVRFTYYERKIKSSFMIYTNIKSNLVPGNDRKQSRDKSYTKKYQKHVFCSYGYQLACVNDKLCKPFK